MTITAYLAASSPGFAHAWLVYEPPTERRNEACGADADCCDRRCEGNVCIGVVM